MAIVDYAVSIVCIFLVKTQLSVQRGEGTPIFSQSQSRSFFTDQFV